MDIESFLAGYITLVPAFLMLLAAALPLTGRISTTGQWRLFLELSGGALAIAIVAALMGPTKVVKSDIVAPTSLGLILAVLVQFLGTIIGGFSARYLRGESGQQRYVTALAAVLAAVQVLLVANHWLILIGAWALAGVVLDRLLCFYPDRAFARLAVHKKRIADRIADLLLIAAAGLAWMEAGDGSFTTLWAHLAREGMTPMLQWSAVSLVIAVALRTALLPVHGWLIQVMEAPTPVSALLHAGVVNLGGFVLIRFAPLLEQATPARALLLALGLMTALLAGMVMLTRISIKVRLAWSTVAQMGFMMLECALGLYTLAALHLIGHSLYKAHAFLSSSSAVRDTRLQRLNSSSGVSTGSIVFAPVLAISAVVSLQALLDASSWPWWWSVLLGLAWAPLLWMPRHAAHPAPVISRGLLGILLVFALTAATMLGHALPLGITDAPLHEFGVIALAAMVALYGVLALLQLRPRLLDAWQRRSYAGFYVDEAYTRLALRLWPSDWVPVTHHIAEQGPAKPFTTLARH